MTMTFEDEQQHALRLEEEYDDLYEEFVCSDDPAERKRCACRMNEIVDETQ